MEGSDGAHSIALMVINRIRTLRSSTAPDSCSDLMETGWNNIPQTFSQIFLVFLTPVCSAVRGFHLVNPHLTSPSLCTRGTPLLKERRGATLIGSLNDTPKRHPNNNNHHFTLGFQETWGKIISQKWNIWELSEDEVHLVLYEASEILYIRGQIDNDTAQQVLSQDISVWSRFCSAIWLF